MSSLRRALTLSPEDATPSASDAKSSVRAKRIQRCEPAATASISSMTTISKTNTRSGLKSSPLMARLISDEGVDDGVVSSDDGGAVAGDREEVNKATPAAVTPASETILRSPGSINSSNPSRPNAIPNFSPPHKDASADGEARVTAARKCAQRNCAGVQNRSAVSKSDRPACVVDGFMPKGEVKSVAVVSRAISSNTTPAINFQAVADTKPPATQLPSDTFANTKTTMHSANTTIQTKPNPMSYVGIILERPETVSSWGLVFTKYHSEPNYAMILRASPPSKDVDGPVVKWCRIASSAPSLSVAYRARTTASISLDQYESNMMQHFPPPRVEDHLQKNGRMNGYINAGDAIIAINGIPVRSFPTLDELASFIQQHCQRKLIIVALRHEHVWNAVQSQKLTLLQGNAQVHNVKVERKCQPTTDFVSHAVRAAWNSILHPSTAKHKQVKRKVVAHLPAAKRPKIYLNSMFRDKNGRPIPYCDNDDPYLCCIYDCDRIHGFLNRDIDTNFNKWLVERKVLWRGMRPKKPAPIIEQEESTVQHDFWLASGHPTFEHWLSESKSTWRRSYSWHKDRRVALQSQCEKDVQFPIHGTSVDFANWLGARKQQWRLCRRKRQHQRAGLPVAAEEVAPDGSSSDLVGKPSAVSSHHNAMYLDEILKDEENRRTKEEEPPKPMDISWVFDASHGAPDDVIANIMRHLEPSDHGNLLCLSWGSNYTFKKRDEIWRSLCPKHWVLPRRPRKSWCALYITKIRAEEEAAQKQSDDLLMKASVIIEKGDQLNKLEKLIRKAKDFDINYVSGVVLERNSLLNLAVIERRQKIVKWLIKRGADIESCDRGQFTPLMNAAWNGDKYITRYLLGKGCDRTKLGKNHSSKGLAPAAFEGLTAEGWARKRGHDEVADLIHFGL